MTDSDMSFPSNLLYMNGQPTALTRRAYKVMDQLTDKAGVFANPHTMTPLEEETLSVLMDIFPKWQPGLSDDD